MFFLDTNVNNIGARTRCVLERDVGGQKMEAGTRVRTRIGGEGLVRSAAMLGVKGPSTESADLVVSIPSLVGRGSELILEMNSVQAVQPTLLQFKSLEIRRTTSMNYIKFSIYGFLRLENC